MIVLTSSYNVKFATIDASLVSNPENSAELRCLQPVRARLCPLHRLCCEFTATGLHLLPYPVSMTQARTRIRIRVTSKLPYLLRVREPVDLMVDGSISVKSSGRGTLVCRTEMKKAATLKKNYF